MNSIGRLVAIASGMLAVLAFSIAQPVAGTPLNYRLNLSESAATSIARLPSVSIESVPIGRLPPEAQQTIDKIERGDLFPYRQDGTVFGNRERRLPVMRYGTYHEYTVPTPGSRTRGARRIITAPQRIYYYTGDHYRTFQQIDRR
jgi:ribonuclease T1